jgi:hypothetical protein
VLPSDMGLYEALTRRGNTVYPFLVARSPRLSFTPACAEPCFRPRLALFSGILAIATGRDSRAWAPRMRSNSWRYYKLVPLDWPLQAH